MSHDFLFKFILTGDSSVGKSALLHRFVDRKYPDEFEATVGVDFKTRCVKIQGKNVMIMTWDTAGQERYRSFTLSYYRGSAVAILVYDITNKESFLSISRWLHDLRTNSSNNPNLTLILVGNKSDSPPHLRAVEASEGAAFAQENGLMFFEASAKTGENVDKVWLSGASDFYEKFENGGIDWTSDHSQGVTIGPKHVTRSNPGSDSLSNKRSGGCSC